MAPGSRYGIVDFAHGLDEPTFTIEDKQRSRITVMSNVDEALRINRNSMRCVAVFMSGLQTCPVSVMNTLVSKCA